MRDRARRVFCGNTLERGDRLRKPEGMQQSNGAVEILTECRCARGEKTHTVAADLVGAGCGMIVLRLGRRLREYGRRRKGQRNTEEDGVLHMSSLNVRYATTAT